MLRLYTELLTVAHEHYGEEIEYVDLVNASIEGMVRSLDPHTSFLSADAYASMRDRQQSTFFGLGILVGTPEVGQDNGRNVGIVDDLFGLWLPIRAPGARALSVLVGVILAAALASLVPALRAYRLSLADGLTVKY